MDIQQPPQFVVVGVDGSPEATRAAQYAAYSAQLRGVSLRVVHAYPRPADAADKGEEYLIAIHASAQRLVEDVLSDVIIPTNLRVDAMAELTSPLILLRDLSRTASLVVIGRQRFRLEDQLLAGPIASPLAAEAACPVIVVPADWRSRPDRHTRVPPRLPIIVTLDGETAAAATLRFAFEEANLRGSPVLALHAGPLHERPAAVAEDEVSVAEILAGVRQDHPDLNVRTLLVPGDPAEAIIAASSGASLMVVGRPHRRHGGGRWSHSVARAVIARSYCPLAVVPHDIPQVAETISRIKARSRHTAT